MAPKIETLLVHADATIREAMERIDRSQSGIALVVDEDRRLVATVTDGDVRRAMLASVELDAPLTQVIERQRLLDEGRPVPLTAPVGTSVPELVTLMQRYDVRQIPIVDDADRVQSLALLHDLLETEGPPLRAVVMAGGYGTRLGDLTAEMPKPMLPVGDRPLLERIIGQLREAGIRHVNLTTHYRADEIARHFGDGHRFGVEIEYVSEEEPLGTAGALGLVEHDGPTLVMNGDILTSVDFRAMHSFHDEHKADMTVAVRPYEVRVPYGLVDLVEEDVVLIEEKPLVRGFVNAGIYLIDVGVSRLVPAGERFEMPELIKRLLDERRRVVGFPLREYWLDIGRVSDYEQALADVEGLA
jgi:dTDP-glucose pyrophosphorylase/CBS domain-containing protein